MIYQHRIVVLGVGQLGSRYLQGLAKLESPSEIWAYDVSEEALGKARQGWDEMSSSTQHGLSMTTDFEDLEGDFDLAILSCTADSRPRLTSELSKKVNVRAWLLEKLLAQSSQGLQIIRDSIPENAPAWVNTPMMTYPLYQQLTPKLNGAPVHANFLNFTGVACNGIHYVDFVARLGDTEVVGVNVDGLRGWTPYVKRPLFFDVEGSMELSYSNGSLLTLSGVSANRSASVDFNIRSLHDDSSHWTIFEQEGRAVSESEEINGQGFLFQSDSTPQLVSKILSKSDTGLPTLNQSLLQHKPFLQALLEHWNAVMSDRRTELPIT